MSAVLHKLGGAGSSFKLTCDPGVDVGDYVYIRADGVLDKARADSLDTMPAIGKVLNKPSSDICVIADKLIDEDYTGVTVKQEFFISETVAGSVQETPPTTSNYILQQIGIGLGPEKIYIDIDPTNIVIRS